MKIKFLLTYTILVFAGGFLFARENLQPRIVTREHTVVLELPTFLPVKQTKATRHAEMQLSAVIPASALWRKQ